MNAIYCSWITYPGCIYGTCASRKLISRSIKPPTVHNDDVGHRLPEIAQPFQALATALIVIQDYPSLATDACASDDNSWNGGSGFASNDDRSTRQHDPGNLVVELSITYISLCLRVSKNSVPSSSTILLYSLQKAYRQSIYTYVYSLYTHMEAIPNGRNRKPCSTD